MIFVFFAPQLWPSLAFADKASTTNVIVLFEMWPPYVFRDGIQIKGIAVDTVRAVLSRAGLEFEQKILPAARVRRDGREKSNILTATLLKVDGEAKLQGHQEQLIGLAAPKLHFHLYSYPEGSLRGLAKNRSQYAPLNVLVLSKFKVPRRFVDQGVIRLIEVHDLELMAKGLKYGRASSVLLDEATKVAAEENGVFAGVVLDRSECLFEAEMYLAFSPETNLAVISAVRTAYAELYGENGSAFANLSDSKVP